MISGKSFLIQLTRLGDLLLTPPGNWMSTVLNEGSYRKTPLDDFLCGEKNFSTRRVQTLINRMRNRAAQKSFKDYFGGS